MLHGKLISLQGLQGPGQFWNMCKTMEREGGHRNEATPSGRPGLHAHCWVRDAAYGWAQDELPLVISATPTPICTGLVTHSCHPPHPHPVPHGCEHPQAWGTKQASCREGGDASPACTVRSAVVVGFQQNTLHQHCLLHSSLLTA